MEPGSHAVELVGQHLQFIPGLNGFVSEFTVLLGAFNSDVLGRWYGVLGATGILLGAIYMLYAAGKVLFGPLQEPQGTPDLSTGLKRDLTRREIAILAPIAVLVVVLGIAPRLITDTLDPALQTQILDRVYAAQKQPRARASGAPSALTDCSAGPPCPANHRETTLYVGHGDPTLPRDAYAVRRSVAGGLP